MSILGNIVRKIFHRGLDTPPAVKQAGMTAAPPPAAKQAPVDVEPILDRMTAQKDQKLDWRHSIVDLMKVLDIDSSLTARKELAQELHYTGSTSDSAAMNIWLHKQVMTKLAENGGRIPDSLKN